MLAFTGPLSTNCVSTTCFTHRLVLHHMKGKLLFRRKIKRHLSPFTSPSIFRVGVLQFSRLLGTFRHVFLCRPPHPYTPNTFLNLNMARFICSPPPLPPFLAAPSPPFHFDPLIIGPNRVPLVSCRVRHGGRSVVHLFCSDQLRQFQPAPPSSERGGWVDPTSLGDA